MEGLEVPGLRGRLGERGEDSEVGFAVEGGDRESAGAAARVRV